MAEKSGGSTNKKQTTQRRVRCQLCGAMIPIENAYCVIKGPKRLYYCSKEEFQGGEEYVKRVRRLQDEIFANVQYIIDSRHLNTLLFDDMFHNWQMMCSLENIWNFYREKRDYLREVILGKQIPDYDKRLYYLNRIFERKISSFVFQKENATLSDEGDVFTDYVDRTMYQPPNSVSRKRRRSISELEDLYGNK